MTKTIIGYTQDMKPVRVVLYAIRDVDGTIVWVNRQGRRISK
jgi:thymidine phosphorylase